MNLRSFVVSVAALAAVACSSTSLHPAKPYGAYAVIVPPSALAQAQPLINEMRGRFEMLDVVTDPKTVQSTYRAVILLKPTSIANGKTDFAYEVSRADFPRQKGVVTVDAQTVDGLDRLVDDAGGRRGLTSMDRQHPNPHIASH
ncbi:MAG: hypothetical protein JWO97_580 [Acidobacteria bacterium]|nr:hypothetical protein [Acidobacteriota bacterium]